MAEVENRAISSVRGTVENAIGALKNMFGIFHATYEFAIKDFNLLLKLCVATHNINIQAKRNGEEATYDHAMFTFDGKPAGVLPEIQLPRPQGFRSAFEKLASFRGRVVVREEIDYDSLPSPISGPATYDSESIASPEPPKKKRKLTPVVEDEAPPIPTDEQEVEAAVSVRTKLMREVLSKEKYASPFRKYYRLWKDFNTACNNYRDYNATRNNMSLDVTYDFDEDEEGQRLYHIQQSLHSQIAEMELLHPFGALAEEDIEHIMETLNAMPASLDESINLEEVDQPVSDDSDSSGPTTQPFINFI